MSQHDRSERPLEARRKAQEAEYFYKQNRELAEKLKARLALDKAGIHDQELSKELVDLGFDADSMRALVFIPLLDVAWADYKIEDEERNQILLLAQRMHIETTSKAHQLIITWMKAKPVDPFFQKGHDLVLPIVQELKKSGKDLNEWIVEASRLVADASHGLFGLGRALDPLEAKVIERIVQNFKSR